MGLRFLDSGPAVSEKTGRMGGRGRACSIGYGDADVLNRICVMARSSFLLFNLNMCKETCEVTRPLFNLNMIASAAVAYSCLVNTGDRR